MEANTTLPVVVVADPFGRAPDRLITEAGATIASIIDGAGDRLHWARNRLRVYQNGVEVLPDAWINLVPAGGDHVLIAPIPQYYAVLYIASYLKAAFSSWSAFSAAASTVVKYATLVTTAVKIVGSLLSGGASSKSTYGISGAGNAAMPDQVCPAVLGKRRVVPPLAATTWTETVGDDVYLRMLVQWHVDRCRVSDIRIGETPIEQFDGVEIQHRLSPADPFPTLYNRIMREDTYGTLQLVHDNGWVQRRTQIDTTEISIDLAWPMGLAWNGKDEARCDVAIQYRAVGASVWITAPVGGGLGHGVDGSIKILETKAQAFRRNFSWPVAKGEYDVQILRTWPDAGDNYPRLQDQVFWVCMRSFGDGLPVIGDNFALTALRIKATNQLNGQIDNLNGLVEAMVPKWDGEQFGAYDVSSNPGELLNWLANGPANAKPLTGRFDVAGIGAFTELCAANDWKCDYILDSDMSVLNASTLVAASGHALGIGWEDGLLSVSVDNEREAPAQVFSGRNVKNFRGTITFPDNLHGVIVSFFDAASGYQQHTRIVYADGYNAATATLFERIDAPTKTDATEAYVVGWRYLAARKLRPEVYEFDTDLEGLVVHFGSRVDIAHSRMAVGICGAQVRSLITREDGAVTGLVLDEIVPMEAGTSYVLRAQRGSSVGLFTVVTVPGKTATLTLKNPTPAANAPVPGNPCVFGVEGKETLPALVVGIATAEDKTSHLTCIPYVEELLTDGGTIPAWDPKITPRAMAEPIATGHVTPVVRRTVDDENVARLANDPVPDGYITNDKIADATFDPVTKFIAGMDAIKIVSGAVLPTTKITNTIFLLGTSKLYRWNATTAAYTAAVDTSDLTGSIVAAQIADASLTTAKFAAGIEPVTIVTGSTVPTTKSTNTIFLTGPGKIFRWVAALGYLASVATTDLSGTITASQIADAALTTAKFAAGIEPVTIVSSGALPTTKSTSTIVYNSKLYRWDATASAYVASVATSDLAGTIATGQIADGAITATKIAAGTITGTQLASSLSVPTVVSSLPVSGGEGQIVVLTTDGKLYRYHSGAWTTAVQTSDLSGTITGGQIAASSIDATKFASGIEPVAIVTGSLPTTKSTSTIVYNSKLYRWNGTAYVCTTDAADLAGAITGGQIAASSIDATKFASGIEPVAIVTGALPSTKSTTTIAYNGDIYRWSGSAYIKTVQTADLSGTITGSQIAASTITAAKLLVAAIDASGNVASGVVGTSQIASGAVTGSNIAAGTITAAKIAAGAIGATQLAANSVAASNIIAGTIVSGNIAAATITGSNIAAGTITANNIAADTITAAQIAAGAVTADELAAGSVTASKVVIAGNNQVLDPQFSDPSYWFAPYTTQISSDATACLAMKATKCASTGSIAGRPANYQSYIQVRNISLTGGTPIRISYDTYVTAGFTGFLLVLIDCYDGQGTALGTLGVNGPNYSTVAAASATTAHWSGIVTPPTGAIKGMLSLYLSCSSTLSNSGTGYWGNPSVINAADGSLIVDGSVTATKIAANTITAAQIAANTITSAQISANTITAYNLAAATITAGQIAAGAIGATQLAAGAVTAKALMVYSNGAALNLDPGFADPSAWTLGAAPGSFVALADGQVGNSAFRSAASSSAIYGTDHIPVDLNKTYRLHMWVRRSASANGNLYGVARLWDTSLTDIAGDGSFWLYNPAGIMGSTTWTEYNYVFGSGTSRTFPANARYVGVGMLLNYGGSAGYYEVQDLRIEEVLPGTLIKDGVITTNKIAAATITATNIAAGTITGNNIAAQTISGSNLVANTITAGLIAAGAIGTGQLAAGAVTATQIASGTITATLIASATITGSLIAAGTITASNIAADTITAGQIAAGAVSTSELASGAVTADKIFAATITAVQIAAGTITATQIASATITGSLIAAGTITASNIATDTITAGQIAAGAVSTSELASSAVTAAKIAAGTITANEIAASTITGAKIAAGTITATNISAGAITADMITSGTLNASLITVTNLSAGSISAGTIAVARLPGLSTLNSWISSQLTNWWPSLSERPSGAPSIPSEKLSMNDGDVTAFSATGSVPFTVDASSAAMTIEFRCTYKPQTSQQANVMAGFMRKNTSTLKYEYMDEATCVVSTGSNAIYNTVISRCRIPVGSYTQLVPWLDNISGNTISVRSVYVEIFQVSK